MDTLKTLACLAVVVLLLGYCIHVPTKDDIRWEKETIHRLTEDRLDAEQAALNAARQANDQRLLQRQSN
jgi:hypothetical protein